MTENKELQLVNNEATENNVPAKPVFADEGYNLIADLTTAKLSFSSMKATTQEEKAKLYNAMNNPDERLADNINKVINAKDLYVEIVNCVNQETGEVTEAPRIVVIDDMGKSYQCVSVGIFSAFKKIIQIFGAPTWETPIQIEVKQISKGQRKMLTLNVIA